MQQSGSAPVQDRFVTLTEREKQTLRLLVRGHDAKSIASELDLSVHTINERLRDVRRKLAVTSSREAARLLAEAEGWGSQRIVDEDLGVADPPNSMLPGRTTKPRRNGPHRLAWLSGGMLIMSLLIAGLVLSPLLHDRGPTREQSDRTAAALSDAPAPVSERQAREWLATVDRQEWEQSWQAAGTPFRAQVTAPDWVTAVRAAREPLGAMSTRVVQSVTRTSTLPGAAPGDYEVVQFTTAFARRSDAIETVVLARERGGWAVVGYFIR